MSEKFKRSLTKIHFGSTLALMLFPFLPLWLAKDLMMLWGLLTITVFIANGAKVDRQKMGMALLFGCLTIFYAFDLFRTNNLREGTFILEKSVALLAIPLLMALLPKRWGQKEIQHILDAFTLGALALALWGNIVFWINGPAPEFAESIASYSYRMTFTQITDVHPTYAAIFFLFGALTQVYRLVSISIKGPVALRIMRIVVAHLLVFFALFAASRTPLIAFFIVLGIFWLRKFGWKRILAPIGITAIALFLAFSFITPLKQRYIQVVETEVALPKGEFHNSVNVRYGIFRCGLELLEDNWLWGTGAGNLQNELNNCYEQFDSPVYDTGNYNVHNQYLDLWLSLGIFGLLAIALIFWIPFSSALKSGSELYLIFIVFFAICCLTENLLARQWGVEFFALFNALFFFNYRHDKLGRSPYVQATLAT